MWYAIIIYLAAAWFFSWWPFDETDRAIESSTFNVYFYYPNDNEEYLGQVKGLSACQSTANGKANTLDMQNSSGWSYICCRVTSSSSCASKHR